MDEPPPENSKESCEAASAVQQGRAARYGRRALMLGAAATGAGMAASLLAGTEPAGAADGKPILLGESNSSTYQTIVTTRYGNGFWAGTAEDDFSGVLGVDSSSGGGYGVQGSSVQGTGVYGKTVGDGLRQAGVEGDDFSRKGSYGVKGFSDKGTGVQGQTEAKGESGVSGIDTSTGGGHGTYGRSTSGIGAYGQSDTGAGVYAKSTSGHALKVVGRVSFSRSGLATVEANETSVTVTLARVVATSMILATLQGDAGAVSVANAVAGLGFFTINLTAAPTSAVQVAWLVLE